VLVYLKAEREWLWARIVERREKGLDADSAATITKALLNQYVDGFDVPRDEGEIVIDVQKYCVGGSQNKV
jgi:hypothetical protein